MLSYKKELKALDTMHTKLMSEIFQLPRHSKERQERRKINELCIQLMEALEKYEC